MKKLYTKPTITELGDIESFIKGMGGPGAWMDIYSKTPCVTDSSDQRVTNLSCGDTYIGSPYSCDDDPASNYFIFSMPGSC